MSKWSREILPIFLVSPHSPCPRCVLNVGPRPASVWRYTAPRKLKKNVHLKTFSIYTIIESKPQGHVNLDTGIICLICMKILHLDTHLKKWRLLWEMSWMTCLFLWCLFVYLNTHYTTFNLWNKPTIMEHVLKEPLLNIYEIKERYNTKCMNIVMRLSVHIGYEKVSTVHCSVSWLSRFVLRMRAIVLHCQSVSHFSEHQNTNNNKLRHLFFIVLLILVAISVKIITNWLFYLQM